MIPVNPHLRSSFFALVLALAAIPSLPAASILRSGDLVAVCGDSITEQKLYSLYIEQYLLLCQPADNLMAMQFGWGGERASGFLARVDNDVLTFKPTVVTTCYGMNDGNYAPVNPGTLDGYRKAMTDSVRKLKAGGVRAIIVGTPGIVDTVAFRRPGADAITYNATLSALAGVAREVAQSENVLFADVYTPMMASMLKARTVLGEGYKIAPDGVHPFPGAHLAMAYAFLKAMDVNGDIGTLTVDYSGNRAVGSSGHRVISYAQGVLRVESTRYPYCFIGKPDGNDTLAMSAFLPFNEELNRYRLVVQNAPARTRITWGVASKEFTAAQLAVGIKLAAEFPENPFSEPFAAATKVMQDQQVFETNGIKNMLNPLARWSLVIPEGVGHIAALRDLIIAKSEAVRASTRAAIRPVAHEIKIEAVQ